MFRRYSQNLITATIIFCKYIVCVFLVRYPCSVLFRRYSQNLVTASVLFCKFMRECSWVHYPRSVSCSQHFIMATTCICCCKYITMCVSSLVHCPCAKFQLQQLYAIANVAGRCCTLDVFSSPNTDLEYRDSGYGAHLEAERAPCCMSQLQS